jgi:hypothetical protein
MRTHTDNSSWLRIPITYTCRSQWPRGLRHELFSPAQMLGSWVRIPLEAKMSVCVYSESVFSCVQVAALRRADPPSKGSYRLSIRLRNWKSGPMSNKELWSHRWMNEQVTYTYLTVKLHSLINRSIASLYLFIFICSNVYTQSINIFSIRLFLVFVLSCIQNTYNTERTLPSKPLSDSLFIINQPYLYRLNITSIADTYLWRYKPFIGSWPLFRFLNRIHSW